VTSLLKFLLEEGIVDAILAVKKFIDQKEKESQRLTLYYNWQVVVKTRFTWL